MTSHYKAFEELKMFCSWIKRFQLVKCLQGKFKDQSLIHKNHVGKKPGLGVRAYNTRRGCPRTYWPASLVYLANFRPVREPLSRSWKDTWGTTTKVELWLLHAQVYMCVHTSVISYVYKAGGGISWRQGTTMNTAFLLKRVLDSSGSQQDIGNQSPEVIMNASCWGRVYW